MVCVLAFVRSLPLNILLTILKASLPLTLMMEIAPIPEAVATATIVSLIILPPSSFLIISKKEALLFLFRFNYDISIRFFAVTFSINFFIFV